MTKLFTTKNLRIGSFSVLLGIAFAVGYTSSSAAGKAQGNFLDFYSPPESEGLTFAQTTKLTASDSEVNDYFGWNVAIDGNTAVIGAYENHPGAAYVFVRSGAAWVEQQKLPHFPPHNSFFGRGVSISGDTVVIAASKDHLEGCVDDPGAVYIFVRSGVTWTQQQRIDHPVLCNSIASQVSVSGNTLVLKGQDGLTTAAYVYVRNGATWTFQQKLLPSTSTSSFGGTLAIHEDTIVVGANHATVNGQTDQDAAYVFVRNGTNWTQQQMLTASDGAAGDRFGGFYDGVSVRGATVIVGAPGSNNDTGAAYIFSRVGSTWTQEQKLVPSDAISNNLWGASVGISGNRAVLGSERVNSSTGAAYVFEKLGGIWTQRQKLLASDGTTLDHFGQSLAISGDTILLGAPDIDNDRGAAYVFRLNRPPADFNGDGKTDVSVFRPSNGQWFSNDIAGTFAQVGIASDKLVPGDYTGDGKVDAAIWRPSTGEWHVVRSENGTSYSASFGINGDSPVVGDFDSDSKTDLAVFRPSNSTWYISKSSGGTVAQVWGISGDVPVVADYDGDAKTDIAIFRPSTGQWWILRSSTGTSMTQLLGASTDKLVPGDYTGDNKADAAIWRPNASSKRAAGSRSPPAPATQTPPSAHQLSSSPLPV